MGSRLKKLRREVASRLPMVGAASGWKEDLLALGHLARCLGFESAVYSLQLWPSQKPGHFLPGLLFCVENTELPFTIGDVPGSQEAAVVAWREFRAGVDPARVGDIFLASQIADPAVVERLCKALESAGIAIPAKSKTDAPALTPVGA